MTRTRIVIDSQKDADHFRVVSPHNYATPGLLRLARYTSNWTEDCSRPV